MLQDVDTCGLRERKKARTREAIIDAALDLFEKKGFEATTVEEIAAAADVSPRTFFRYFESKLDLVMWRNSSEKETIADTIKSRPPEESALDAMHNGLRSMLAERLADAGLAREFQVTLGSPTLRNLAWEHLAEEQEGLAAALAERLGVEPGNLAAHVMAGAVSAAMWAVIDRWAASGSTLEQFVPMVDEAFDLLRSGLGSATAAS